MVVFKRGITALSVLILIFSGIFLLPTAVASPTSIPNNSASKCVAKGFSPQDLEKNYQCLKTIMLTYKTVKERLKFSASLKETNNMIFCHVLDHDNGILAYTQTKSIAASLALGGVNCTTGYMHGIFEVAGQRSSLEQYTTQVRTVCNPYLKNPLVLLGCTHGMGHGMLVASKFSLPLASNGCKTLKNVMQINSCRNGIVMEAVTTGVVKDKILTSYCLSKEISSINLTSACFTYGLSEYGALKNLPIACDKLPKAFISDCYFGIGDAALALTKQDVPAALLLCGSNGKYSDLCLHHVAQQYGANNGYDKMVKKVCPLALKACKEVSLLEITSGADIYEITHK